MNCRPILCDVGFMLTPLRKSSYELMTAFSYRLLTPGSFAIESADDAENRCYKGGCDPEATSPTEQPSCQR